MEKGSRYTYQNNKIWVVYLVIKGHKFESHQRFYRLNFLYMISHDLSLMFVAIIQNQSYSMYTLASGGRLPSSIKNNNNKVMYVVNKWSN